MKPSFTVYHSITVYRFLVPLAAAGDQKPVALFAHAPYRNPVIPLFIGRGESTTWLQQ